MPEEDRAGVRSARARAARGRRSRRAGARARSRFESRTASSSSRTRIRAPNRSRLSRARSPRLRRASCSSRARADPVDQRCVPGDQDARARRVLGLADQVGGDVVGLGRPVGDQDDLARPGDAVDVDLAVDVPLGQGDEQVARPDDLVDRRRSPRRRTPGRRRPGRRRSGRPRSRPARGRRPAGRRCSRRTGSAARRRRSRATPAACAGTTVISSVDGYAAAPPGMQTPTRRSGRYRSPSSIPGPPSIRDVAVEDARWKARMFSRTFQGLQVSRIGGPVGAPRARPRRRGPTPARASTPSSRRCSRARRQPAAATSAQIRSTTCWGVSGSPNAAIVRARPSGLTTLPLGLSSRRSSAIAARASSLEQSIRRMFKVKELARCSEAARTRKTAFSSITRAKTEAATR